MRWNLTAARWIVMVALVSVVPAVTFAQQQRGGQDRDGWWKQPRVQKALGLTPEQQAGIAELEREKREEIQAARRAVAAAMRQLVAALDDESPSEEAIQAARSQLEEAWADHLQVTMDHWQALRSQLNEEQWKALPNAAPSALRLGMLQLRSRQGIEVGEQGDTAPEK